MKNNNKGFSLVELIVVIAIMAILAAVAVVGFSLYIPKAQQAADKIDSSKLEHSTQYAAWEEKRAQYNEAKQKVEEYKGAETQLANAANKLENAKKLYAVREDLSGVLKNTGYFSGVFLTDDWNEFMNRATANLEAERLIAVNDASAYIATKCELEKQKERLLIYSV
jgi:prepilin-type N-terminal cleavage/methylation domain-containing protein